MRCAIKRFNVGVVITVKLVCSAFDVKTIAKKPFISLLGFGTLLQGFARSPDNS